MKQFACGDIVPGCPEEYRRDSDEAILAVVAEHAREVHGLDEIPDDMIAEVRSRIRTVDD